MSNLIGSSKLLNQKVFQDKEIDEAPGVPVTPGPSLLFRLHEAPNEGNGYLNVYKYLGPISPLMTYLPSDPLPEPISRGIMIIDTQERGYFVGLQYWGDEIWRTAVPDGEGMWNKSGFWLDSEDGAIIFALHPSQTPLEYVEEPYSRTYGEDAYNRYSYVYSGEYSPYHDLMIERRAVYQGWQGNEIDTPLGKHLYDEYPPIERTFRLISNADSMTLKFQLPQNMIRFIRYYEKSLDN